MTAAREYRMCTRTVMDTTDPDITFDSEGVSSHALRYDREFAAIVDAATKGERLGELQKIVAEIKKAGEGKPYDCIVGVSGGVDSTYLILQAVKLGLRPLAVHFDSGWNSELAVGNIKNIVDRLGLDLYTDVVDWREMRDLQLSFFKASVPNCDIPTDHAFSRVAFQQAEKYGIKYILGGSNLASESVLPQAWGYNASDARHLKAIQRKFGSVKLKTYPTLGLFKRHIWYEAIRGIKTVKMLNYLPYNYVEAKAQITEELGWRDYGGKHYESVFTRYFQGYYLPMKFGFDKRLAHYSSLILSGQMTREEALELLKQPNYPEALRKQDHEFIAKKLGVSTSELEEIYARPIADHMSYPNSKWAWDQTLKLARLAARLVKRFRR
ncbi:N-acetyl sugar amidotransferase [Ruicaihuangia caeni]|uniref:N-acetyl sugar amidotransferase n=1 Tax=Ruicaihuangia caeni TaxID=3042517 RepID=A0AAW6T6F4_9MICO|nr:N-acetyl sugar amidotransferase [Klugiella sp. YN-L-19]MDI2099410.1 N-acetyl sugar amidotransferase [Klugiella sp. YN-L-19]